MTTHTNEGAAGTGEALPVPVVFDGDRARFGAYLREQRCARGFSLREAAERLGITCAKLQRIEVGGPARIGSPAFLDACAELYGRKPEEVFTAAGAGHRHARPEQRAVVLDGTDTELETVVNGLLVDGWRVQHLLALQTLQPHHFRPLTGRLLVILERHP